MISKVPTTPSESLKVKHKAVAERHAEPSRVRLHRAISWLKRAEQEAGDSDAQFIFLWIAFNAAYAKEFGFETTERDQIGKASLRLAGRLRSNRSWKATPTPC
jgi:hypothetical protein